MGRAGSRAIALALCAQLCPGLAAATGWSAQAEAGGHVAQLCALSETAPACLILACAAPGAPLGLFYAEPAALPGFGRLAVHASIDGAAPRTLIIRLDPSVTHRRGSVEIDPARLTALRAALANGRVLALSHGEGVWELALDGTAEALGALDAVCATVAPRETEPTALAGRSGQIPVMLDRDGWHEASGTVKALATGAHGWRTTLYIRQFRERPRIPVAKAYAVAPGRYLLIAELCGVGDYFGPDGCGLYVSSKTEGHWSVVTVRPSDTPLTLDLDRRSDAVWPDIVATDGQRWVWRDDAYQPGL